MLFTLFPPPTRPALTSLASPSPLISPVLLFSAGRRPAGANKSKTPPKSRPDCELSSRESLAESPKTRETRGKLKCMVAEGRGGIVRARGKVLRSRNRVDARSMKHLNYLRATGYTSYSADVKYARRR